MQIKKGIMDKSFASLSHPLVVGSIRQSCPEDAVKDIKAAEQDGAHAFILHIQLLAEQYRTYEALRTITLSTNCPIMAIYYKGGGDDSDEHKVKVQMEAVRAGFSSVDLRADLFDSNPHTSLTDCTRSFARACPNEVSMDVTAIQKQKALIEELHNIGAEVLMSAHVSVELSQEQAVDLALEIRSRGADIVKIITSCKSTDQLLEMLRTTVVLKKRLEVPYVYCCNGEHGALLRPIAPLFGSMLVFGHHEYGALSNKEKPLLEDINELYRIIKWRMPE
jgi:3-dehydroquinate dehydratase